VKARDEMRQKL